MGNTSRLRDQERSSPERAFLWKALLTFFVVCALFVTVAPGLRAQISVGIQIGAPPPPRVLAVIPPTPGPGYVWVEGYWYPVGRHYRWHAGYWTIPPYPGSHWVPPRHDGGRYFVGYWDGDRGRFEHDHHWDKDRDRDRGRWHDHEDHDRQDDHR